jgi:hypothetical protein
MMRRNVGRHADGDPGGPVDEQIRDASGQHDRLGLRAVVVRPEVHRSLVDLFEHLVGETREAALGVSHGRRAVAVERPEIAGPVDERIAERKGLRHADERLVERGVAMRVIAAHHVADDLGALAMLGIRGQILLPHRVEDAALYRLEAVAHVRQRTRRDDRERVIQVAALCRFMQGNIGCAARWRRRNGALRAVIGEIEQ